MVRHQKCREVMGADGEVARGGTGLVQSRLCGAKYDEGVTRLAISRSNGMSFKTTLVEQPRIIRTSKDFMLLRSVDRQESSTTATDEIWQFSLFVVVGNRCVQSPHPLSLSLTAPRINFNSLPKQVLDHCQYFSTAANLLTAFSIRSAVASALIR